MCYSFFFFFSSRRRHTRFDCDWSSDVCSSDLLHRERAGSKVAGRLIEQQRDDLVGGLSEFIRRGFFVAQSRQVVGDQRVLDDMQRHEAPLTLPRKRGRESLATEIVGGSVPGTGSAMRA